MNPQDSEWLVEVFKKTRVFADFSDKELQGLTDHMERANYARGDIVLKQGETGEWFYIIRSGKISVRAKKSFFNREKEIAVLHPQDFFGEMALLTDKPRIATLVAEEDTVCFTLFKNKFNDLIQTKPAIKKSLEDMIRQRSGPHTAS